MLGSWLSDATAHVSLVRCEQGIEERSFSANYVHYAVRKGKIGNVNIQSKNGKHGHWFKGTSQMSEAHRRDS